MLPDYFSERVLRHPGRGCWEWQGVLNNKGYGMMYVREWGRRSSCHRAAYQFYFGQITDGSWVLHKCDNPRCVRPSHLFLGSPLDNIRDMIAKGRDNRSNNPRGEENGCSKMTTEGVIALREAYIAGASRKEMAVRFELSELSISDYVLGRSWRHVTDGPTREALAAESERRKKIGAKITKEVAEEIRRRLGAGELGKDLAVEYGIHKATISDIRQCKIWR